METLRETLYKIFSRLLFFFLIDTYGHESLIFILINLIPVSIRVLNEERISFFSTLKTLENGILFGSRCSQVNMKC